MVLVGEMVDANLASAGLASEVVPAKRLLPRALEIGARSPQNSVAITPTQEGRARSFRNDLGEGLRTEHRLTVEAFATSTRR